MVGDGAARTPDAMSRQVLRVAFVVVGGLGGLALLAGALFGAAQAYETTRVALIPPVPPWGNDVWDDELRAFFDEHGSFPPDEPYSPQRLDGAIAFEAGLASSRFQTAHPDAEVPDVAFIALDDAARDACLGTPVVEDPWGGIEQYSTDLARAVIEYTCVIQYPPYPHMLATDRQIRFMYAFNTEYVLPCLEAHGVLQAPAVSEDEFVATYYTTRPWHPKYPDPEGPPFVDAWGYNLCPQSLDDLP